MTSSVDPTAEIGTIKSRLDALATGNVGLCYEGVDAKTTLAVDAFGNKQPYRDFEPGSVIPAAKQRMLAAGEQGQPHVWAFQIHHVAPTRAKAVALSIETDKSLIGWVPSNNASPISTFFFSVYDDTARNGEKQAWIATRFYETTLGQNPDPATNIPAGEAGYGAGGYGQ